LPHTLTADAEEVTYFLQTMRLVRVQTIAQTHNKRLTCREVHEAFFHTAAHLLLRHECIGLRRLGIRQHILERIAIVRDGLLQLRERLDGDQEIFHFLGRPAEGSTELLCLRSASLVRPQLGRSSVQLALTLYDVTRQPDRPVLLAEGAADGLADPPMGIGDKTQSTTRLELVHRTHQPQISLLNQVEKRHTTVAKARRHMNDETQIRLHHLRFGLVKLSLGARPGSVRSLQGWVLWLCPPGVL